jgi:CBS domain-containing membrane protein
MLKINDIMTHDVFSLNANQTFDLARNTMKSRHIRHVPIIDDHNRFVGLITHRDMLAHTISILADIDEKEQKEIDQQILIKNIMNTNVVTAPPDMELKEAISILLENKYGCLPVVAEEKLVGIITEADFLKFTYDLLSNQMLK